VSKLLKNTGEPPKVTAETGLAAPTMTTDGQRVYAIFANGDLAALDFDGKAVWSKKPRPAEESLRAFFIFGHVP